MSNLLHAIWYEKHALRFALAPASALFCAIVQIRRFAYRYKLLKSKSFSTPVIVVGNITVGGTGKTPLVIWLAQFLKQQGFQPAIVSRGYGGKSKHWPQQVRADSDPSVQRLSRCGCAQTVAGCRKSFKNISLRCHYQR